MVLVKASTQDDAFLLDGLSSAVRGTSVAAFSLRLLSQTYTGPVVQIRHGTTGTTKDFFADVSGNLGDQLGALGESVETFLGGASGFVTTWYDQSGNNLHATQTTQANQPFLIRGSGSTTSAYVIQFTNGLRTFNYDGTGTSSVWHNSNYTMVVKERRGSSANIRYFLGTLSQAGNQGLHLGYRNNTTATHAQWFNDYNTTIPGYTGSIASEPTRRWVFSHHNSAVPGKRIFLNGVQVGSRNNNTPLSSPGQAVIGTGFGLSSYYEGEIHEVLLFNQSLPVLEPSAIAYLDASLAASGVRRAALMSSTVTRSITSMADPRGMRGIPPSVMDGCVGAYAANRLMASYHGPVVRMRRDTDNAEADVWTDFNGTVVRVVDLSLDDDATSGGTVTYDGGYRIHTFTSSGTFVVNQPRTCDVLVVGGGGGGGFDAGGGGGAGGVIAAQNEVLSTGNKLVVLGAGGSRSTTVGSTASNGGNTVFDALVAIGGGGGGSKFSNGATGGSGGGSGHGGGDMYVGGNGVPGRGKKGGFNGYSGGGGGGGALTEGGNATFPYAPGGVAGSGGNGIKTAMRGSIEYYGGGGGGGNWSTVGGQGGAGGGGNGGGNAIGFRFGENGAINSGGGGGANGFSEETTSGNGGSGIVIVRTLRHVGLQGRNALQQWLGASTGTVIRLYDQSGNANHATDIRGNPRLSSGPNEPFLFGSTTDGIRFPAAILPTDYTFFGTAQYQSNGSNASIFAGASNDWFSSYDGGIQKRFGWVTNATSNLHSSNVVVTVDQPSYFRANGGINSSAITSFMRQYPAGNLTDFTTTISSASYGNGTYVVSSSETENANIARRSWTLFRDNYNTTVDGYHSAAVFSSYTYTGTGTTNIDGTNQTALWIQIQLPESIVMKGYKFVARNFYASNKERLPNEFWIVGSTNGTSWTTIDYQPNYTVSMYNSLMTSVENTVEGVFYTPNNTQAYNFYRLVVRKNTPVNSATIINFWNWTLFSQLTARTGQLSINHGANARYTNWRVRDVMVFNSVLPLSTVRAMERQLLSSEMGVLDEITTSTAAGGALAAYAARLLTVSYTGPVMRIRNDTTNVETDVYANIHGDLGLEYWGRGSSVREWLGSAAGHVVQWYDQSGRGFHLTQSTPSLQPSLTSSTQGTGVRFQNQNMTAGNVFGVATVTNAHVMFAQRESTRSMNILLSLNGVTDDSSCFRVHSPWSDGQWYFDAGDASSSINRSSSIASATSVGKRAIFSGYKSSTEARNAFRLNGGGTLYASPQSTAAPTSGGLVVGGFFINPWNYFASDHTMYALMIFGAKLPSAHEALLEARLASFCAP
jgi:hypothetical protein